jgi:hypothetical protein
MKIVALIGAALLATGTFATAPADTGGHGGLVALPRWIEAESPVV